MSDLKPCPHLEPCPHCGKQPHTVWRKVNPRASCKTEGCFGRKMAVINLDDPEDVAAWNRRAQPAQAGQVLTDEEIEAAIRPFYRDSYSAGMAMLNNISEYLAVEQAVLAKRVPMKREEVKELARKVGYDNATAQERADFINGIRHGERYHGIGYKK